MVMRILMQDVGAWPISQERDRLLVVRVNRTFPDDRWVSWSCRIERWDWRDDLAVGTRRELVSRRGAASDRNMN
jgi:hypothetical protein